MFRSFLAQILLLQCMTISFITVGFYSTHQQKDHKSFASTPIISEKNDANRQSEVAIFWTPKETTSEGKYHVVRKNVSNQKDESLLATVDPSNDVSNHGYFKVSDQRVANGQYSYEVVQVTPQGSQIVASLAYALPTSHSITAPSL